MNAPIVLSKVEQIRARDGDECWLCTRPLDFTAAPNSKNAPTIEHLVAKSSGGSGDLANLALCHKACNLHLGDRPLAKKQEMRVKFHANAAKNAAVKGAQLAKAPQSKLSAKALTPQLEMPPREQHQHPSMSRPTPDELGAEIAYWRRLALVGGGAGLVSLGFTVGLCAGLLAS